MADRARARLFAAEWPDLAEFRETQALAHPAGAARQQDVESDAPGRFSDTGVPRQSGDQETSYRHKTATEFSRQIVKVLQDGKTDNAYGRLVIIAPALFLGVLREQLPDPVKALVVADVDKNLTQARVETIRSEVGELIAAQTEI